MNQGHSASNSAVPSFHESRVIRIADSSLPDLKNGPTDISPFLDYREASDEELLAAARSSDERAFAELSDRYRKSIHNMASRIVRNHDDAEDVVQDAFLKAYIHLKNFRGTCRFSTWLTTIAVNSALMLLRKRRVRPEVSFQQRANEHQIWEIWDYPDRSPNPEQVYARCQERELLSRAVTRLPPSYRSVMTQYLAHDQSLQQIADTVGITLTAAKSRLLRARLSIRSALREVILRQANGIEEPMRSSMHSR